LSRARILVVDDDEAAREVAAEVLRATGREIAVAANGVEALDVMENAQVPDLVLLDLMMPRMGGREVIAQMGARPRLACVPVIVLTSFTSREDIPVHPYVLHKPVDIEQLLKLVNAILEPGAADLLRERGAAERLDPSAGSD
jgi:CheY-like chemotaxis protein